MIASAREEEVVQVVETVGREVVKREVVVEKEEGCCVSEEIN